MTKLICSVCGFKWDIGKVKRGRSSKRKKVKICPCCRHMVYRDSGMLYIRGIKNEE